MTKSKSALWFWDYVETSPGYAVPFNRPAVQYAKVMCNDIEPPTESAYPYKPWDAAYDRRKDPMMIIMDHNKEIERLAKYNGYRGAWINGLISEWDFKLEAHNIGERYGKKAERAVTRWHLKYSVEVSK